jgi:hypothetical protein
MTHCPGPLIEIDHYGERLIGCIECNRWGRPGDATPPMQLLEDDLEPLRAGRRRVGSNASLIRRAFPTSRHRRLAA